MCAWTAAQAEITRAGSGHHPAKTPRFVPNTPTSTGCDGISFSTTNATHRRWGPAEIEAFLTHLAIAGNVARSTQNQAFNALLFLYREVLGISLDDAGINATRAHKKGTLPVVLTRDEVQRVIMATTGVHQLIAKLLYGSGV